MNTLFSNSLSYSISVLLKLCLLLLFCAACDTSEESIPEGPQAFGFATCGPLDGGAYDIYLSLPQNNCASQKTIDYNLESPAQSYTRLVLHSLQSVLTAGQTVDIGIHRDTRPIAGGGIQCVAGQSCRRVSEGTVFVLSNQPDARIQVNLQYEDGDSLSATYTLQHCAVPQFTCP